MKSKNALTSLFSFLFAPAHVEITVRRSDGKQYQYCDTASAEMYTTCNISEDTANNLPILNGKEDTFVKLIAARAADTNSHEEIKALLIKLKADPSFSDSELVQAERRYPSAKPKAIYEAMAYYHNNWHTLFSEHPPIVDSIFMKIKQELKNMEQTRVKH